jgi:hypothetical protein
MPFIVMTSSAAVNANGRGQGRYINVAVVQVEDPAVTPKMISTHARNVKSIVKHYGKCSQGVTLRCAAARAQADAYALAKKLNEAEATLKDWNVLN